MDKTEQMLCGGQIRRPAMDASKPRLVEVTGDDRLKALATKGDLATPIFILDGARMYMLADQFRAWKSFQDTSGAAE